MEDWIEEHGNIAGRFRFFGVYKTHSQLYLRVGNPLLSMNTAGSKSVERAAKPIKESILSKKRNLLSDEKKATIFRAAQNLRMLHKARQSIKGRVYDGHAL